jgi:hypothetical protein
MHLVHNERTKLTATWINGLAVAFIAAGIFAPAAAFLYGLSLQPIGWDRALALTAACLIFGFGIHVGARVVLRRLRE